jgi:hypothetical protein
MELTSNLPYMDKISDFWLNVTFSKHEAHLSNI